MNMNMKKDARARERGKGGEGGYTMVEVMAALLLFGIGLVGIMGMQVLSTKGNADSNNITSATSMAEWWMERMRLESLAWNLFPSDLSDKTRTPLLFKHGANSGIENSTTGWVKPDEVSVPAANPRYDRWMRAAASAAAPGEFCTQYRLTTLSANELLRVEVRVMWWKPGTRDANWATCPTGMLTAGLEPDTTKVRSVTLTSTLWRHGFI